jgi:hypothetical protein
MKEWLLKEDPYHDASGKFTTKEKAQQKLDALEDWGDEEKTVSTDAVFKDVHDGAQMQVPESAYKLTSVKLADLEASQGGLHKDKIARNFSKDVSKQVTVVKLPDGRMLIQDGHHRAAAKILEGQKTLQVKLATAQTYDYDEDLNSHKATFAKSELREWVVKANPNHDPETGEFTSGSGGQVGIKASLKARTKITIG